MHASSPFQLALATNFWQTANNPISPDEANLRGKIGFIFAGTSLMGNLWGMELYKNALSCIVIDLAASLLPSPRDQR